MAQSTINSDLFIAGTLSARAFTPPAASVRDASVADFAGIQAAKLQHQNLPLYRQKYGTATTADRMVLHRIYGTTATLVAFRCGLALANTGNATVTIDLYRNGASILTATTVLDSTNTAYTAEDAAGFTTTALAAGDTLEVVVTVNAGTGVLGQGLFCQAIIREDAA